MYNLFGLDLKLLESEIKVGIYLGSGGERIEELFTVERWLKETHTNVYTSYKSAIDSFKDGNFETSIEACRTAYISMFGKFQGKEETKIVKGIFNFLEAQYHSDEIKKALREINKQEMAEFFNENREGKLTKTKTFYMFYCMMSDYGTHRNQNNKEIPTQFDALFILRIIESIFFWMYEKSNN